MKFWKLFDWQNKNSPKQDFGCAIGLFFIIFTTYYFGLQPNKNYLIFLVCLFLIITTLSHIFLTFIIQKIYTSFFHGETTKKLDILIEKIIFYMYGFSYFVSYLITSPIAHSVNQSSNLIIIIYLFIIVEFIQRKNALSWKWENPNTDGYFEEYWKSSKEENIQFYVIQLHLIPITILLFHLNNINLFINESISFPLKEGFGWYFFYGIASLYFLIPISGFIISFYKPEWIWSSLEPSFYEIS